MYLAYFDESGDDGLGDSSPLFVMSCVYMHHQYWKSNFQLVQVFRKKLAREHGFPFNWEMHTREFLLDKSPFRELGKAPAFRVEVLDLWCQMIASLECRILNVVINKKVIRRPDYPVLDTAFTYAIQRIENDLKGNKEHFLIITDEGRVGMMRSAARRIQRFNPIPSHFGPDSYQNEIELLVEDPLPKNSKESHFIQIADLVSYLIRLQMGCELDVQSFPNRLKKVMERDQLNSLFEVLKPRLNLDASRNHPLGVVCYPRG